MKNNTLKKISAIALAAVMAVTFAPVASLQAFAAAKAVTVSGTGNSLLDKDYDSIEAAVKALVDAKSTKGTITLNVADPNVDSKNDGAGTYDGQTVTGGALYFKGYADAQSSYTLDLGEATTDLGPVIVDSRVDLTIKGGKTDVRLGKITIGHQNDVKDDVSNVTIDSSKVKTGDIDVTFANLTLNDGKVDGDITFEAGVPGTPNAGAKAIKPSIGKSSFTMNGGWITGEINNAGAAAWVWVEKGYTTTTGTTVTQGALQLREGVGSVKINQGTFTKNPLGNTHANYRFDYEDYKETAPNATFGFFSGKSAATDGQDVSMIGDTPVAQIDLGEGAATAADQVSSGSLTDNDLYYAGQDLIDKKVASINDSTEKWNTYKDFFTNTNTVTIRVIANATKINKAPWGAIVETVHKKTSEVVSPTSVEVNPRDGVSKLDKKVVVKANKDNPDRVTTTYTTYVGDKTIINEVGKSLEDYKKDLTDKDPDSDAVYTNGGDSLQVVADGKTYVTPSVLNDTLDSAKEIEVVELTSRAKMGASFKYALLGSLDTQFNGIAANNYNFSSKADEVRKGVKKDATVKAGKKYTVLSSTKDGKRYVTVTNARVAGDYLTAREEGTSETSAFNGSVTTDVSAVPVAPFVTAKDNSAAVYVEQTGDGDIATSANGILFVELANGGVTTKDTSLLLANDGTTTFVGTKAAQLAAVSKEGRNIYTTYYVARVPRYLPAPYQFGGIQNFTQGDVYLTEVPRAQHGTVFNGNGWTEAPANVMDKDATTTWVDFVDMTGRGLRKTPNITTNAFGVQMVSSVNVQYGTGESGARNVYRFRNTKNGEHLYTIQLSEINDLLKSDEWVLENSNAFTVLPADTKVEGAVPVRRYHNIKTNEFLYSTDVNGEQVALDADPNWVREGIAFCGVSAADGYAVTRVTNVYFGGHVYSTSRTGEVEPLLAKNQGYKVDGTVFFAVDTPEKEK